MDASNTHKRKIIGHIFAFFILTAYDQVLEQAVSCKALCAAPHHGTLFRSFNFTQMQSISSWANSRVIMPLFHILLIIRIHILVKTSRGNRMSAGLDLKQHAAQTRRTDRPHKSSLHAFAGTLLQLAAIARSSCFLTGSLQSVCHLLVPELRIAGSIINSSLTADDHSFQESGNVLA